MQMSNFHRFTNALQILGTKINIIISENVVACNKIIQENNLITPNLDLIHSSSSDSFNHREEYKNSSIPNNEESILNKGDYPSTLLLNSFSLMGQRFGSITLKMNDFIKSFPQVLKEENETMKKLEQKADKINEQQKKTETKLPFQNVLSDHIDSERSISPKQPIIESEPENEEKEENEELVEKKSNIMQKDKTNQSFEEPTVDNNQTEEAKPIPELGVNEELEKKSDYQSLHLNFSEIPENNLAIEQVKKEPQKLPVNIIKKSLNNEGRAGNPVQGKLSNSKISVFNDNFAKKKLEGEIVNPTKKMKNEFSIKKYEALLQNQNDQQKKSGKLTIHFEKKKPLKKKFEEEEEERRKLEESLVLSGKSLILNEQSKLIAVSLPSLKVSPKKEKSIQIPSISLKNNVSTTLDGTTSLIIEKAKKTEAKNMQDKSVKLPKLQKKLLYMAEPVKSFNVIGEKFFNKDSVSMPKIKIYSSFDNKHEISQKKSINMGLYEYSGVFSKK